MAGFLSNLLDKDNPVKKLQKEIAGMELKKQSLIASVQNEVNTARNQIDSVLYQIGSDVYAGHLSGDDIGDKLSAHYNGIESLTNLISAKEDKIKEIASRYDEEIGMLNAHLSQNMPQPVQSGAVFVPPQVQQSSPSAGSVCPNCGKPFSPGEDMFCVGCGQKL